MKTQTSGGIALRTSNYVLGGDGVPKVVRLQAGKRPLPLELCSDRTKRPAAVTLCLPKPGETPQERRRSNSWIICPIWCCADLLLACTFIYRLEMIL